MASCPKCKTSYSGEARLCRNCGGALPALDAVETAEVVELVLPGAGVRVCAGCGLCVPAKHRKCSACTGQHEARVVPPRADGAYWVRARCEYRCAGCEARVPLRSFIADGRSECVLCAFVHENAVMFWRMVLAHAHAVGDLAGPAPEGRLPHAGIAIGARNPFRVVGLDVAELEDERVHADEDTASELAAGPGHPMCLGCGTPIDEGWSGGDAACATCGVAVHGVKPSKAMPVDRGLVAILCRAPVEAKGGVIALRCPTCSAALTVEEGATQVTCKYCQGTSLIARPTARSPIAAEPGCWMLFKGPSKRRADLQSRA